MTRQKVISAAQAIVSEALSKSSFDLVAELAEPLAEHVVRDYGRQDWQDSPIVEALAHVAAVLEAQGREIPLPILDALRAASDAGQPVGVA
jgi:hypothetical protein